MKTTTTRSRGTASTVIAMLAPLRESPAGRLDVRIIELRGARRLDIRQYVTSETFTGYTRKGICVSAEELQVLLAHRDKIEAMLEGRKVPASDRTRRAQHASTAKATVEP